MTRAAWTLPTPIACSAGALLFGVSPSVRPSNVGPAEIWYSGIERNN
jgi:hypothetical protein